MNTKWLIFLLIIAVLLGSWFAWNYFAPGRPIEVAEVHKGPIREFVDERAMTRLPQTYLITMPQNGHIAPIELEPGTPVKKGEVVARIIPLDLKLAVEEATAAVERLEAAIQENAETNVEETAFKQAEQFVVSMNETVKAAAARVESGRAKHDYAEKQLGRTLTLFETKARTQEQLDQARLAQVESRVDYQQDQLVYSAMQALQAATNLLPTMVRQYIGNKNLREAVLRKQKAEAEAQLAMILEEQRRGTMTSPVDGVVLSRQITNERFLSAGATLLELGRLKDLEVEADVLSLDVVDVKQGDSVEIHGPAVGPKPARGRVARIYPAGFTKVSSLGVEQQRVKVIVRFAPEELERLIADRHLGVGYRVRIRIITSEKPEALVIPRSALLRGSKTAWQVFAVQNGRTRLVDVRVGLMNDEQAEITAGLNSGDLVVRTPESHLATGLKVTPSTRP